MYILMLNSSRISVWRSCSVVLASLGREVVVVPGEQAQRRRPTAVQSHDDFVPVFVMFHLQEVLIGRPDRRACDASKANPGERERANRSARGHGCWEGQDAIPTPSRPQIKSRPCVECVVFRTSCRFPSFACAKWLRTYTKKFRVRVTRKNEPLPFEPQNRFVAESSAKFTDISKDMHTTHTLQNMFSEPLSLFLASSEDPS